MPLNPKTKYALLGTYSTPVFKYGDVVFCEMRGEVTLVGLSKGRIPWPLGRRNKGGPGSPVIYDGLAQALKRESGRAVCYWWGVTGQTVSKWRKVLNVGPVTEGTSALKRENFSQPWGQAARRKAWSKARDPERRRKIAESKRGKPRPPGVMAAAHNANRGRKHSAQTLAAMSASAKKRAVRPAWTDAEDAVVMMLSAEDAATVTGRSLSAVKQRRQKLSAQDGQATNDA